MEDLLPFASLILFLLVQIFVLITILVLRYHFRAFALPHDRTASRIVWWFSAIAILLFLVELIFIPSLFSL